MTAIAVQSAFSASASMRVLLLEPNMVLRQTVTFTARSLGIGHIHQAGSAIAARRMLEARAFDAVILAIEDDKGMQGVDSDLDLIFSIREGDTQCNKNVFVGVLTPSCDAKLVQTLKSLQVQRVLVKPFRVRDIIETLSHVQPAA